MIDQVKIMVAWLPTAFTISVELVTDKLIHCKIEPKTQLAAFMCSFVYGSNDKKERITLWQFLFS